ncbi:DMT family transporter [Nonomuraea sp. NPDC003707]
MIEAAPATYSRPLRRGLSAGTGLLVLVAVGWAAYTPVTAVALAQLPLTVVLLTEVVVAAALLWLVTALRGYRPVPALGRVALLGVLEPGANCVFFAGALTILPAAESSLLLSGESALVAALGVLVLGERLGRAGWAGLLVCIPGLWLLSGMPSPLHISLGVLLVLAATTASAIYSTAAAGLARTCARDTLSAALSATAWQFTAGLACVAALALGHALASPRTLAADLADAAPSAWAAAAVGGLLLALPCVLYNHVIRRMPIAEAGVILNLIPVIGAAIGVLWLGDTLTSHHLWGAAITVAGVATLTVRR